MVTIDLPAVDSVVNVTVTAANAFGSGPASHISVDEISELPNVYVHMVLLIYNFIFTCVFTCGTTKTSPLLCACMDHIFS